MQIFYKNKGQFKIISFRGEGIFQNMVLYDIGEWGGGGEVAQTIKPPHIEAASQNKNGLGAYTILVNSCRLLLLKPAACIDVPTGLIRF